MNISMQLYLQQLFNQFSSQCDSAQARIRSATTMRGVKQAANVHASATVRAMPEIRRLGCRVHDCAEDRMSALLQPHLQALAACASSSEMRTLYGRLVRDEWIFLRGDFSRVYVQADREYHRLLHLAVKAEARPADPEEGETDGESESEGESERPAP